MKENKRVSGIRFEDASECGTRIRYYAIWHKEDGVKWAGEVLFKTKEEAFDHVMKMPNHYAEGGDAANAKRWKDGEHVIVPVEVPVPNGIEE